MGSDNVGIRDLARPVGEWTPPLSALGGPPAHQLYTDLVQHAGLQLFRDAKGRPWVVLRDGAQRRAFLAPSVGLRSALDRFRMRRNLRPVPGNDIEEFVRVVEARVSDPDASIPLLRSPVVDHSNLHEWHPALIFSAPDRDDPSGPVRPGPPGRPGGIPHPAPEAPVPTGPDPDPTRTLPVSDALRLNPSISGARAVPPENGADLARYVRLFRTLLREGDWMGTTQELSRLTNDDPFQMFDTLLRYRAQLVENDILIANVEVGGTYQWLAVDKGRLRPGAEAETVSEPVLAVR